MITTQYGNEVKVATAFYGRSGAYVGAECVRVSDGASRYYRLHQLRATEGAEEVYSALDAAANKEQIPADEDDSEEN